MCGCSTHQPQANQAAERYPDALTLRVEDMTCGHCAGTIKKAIETGLPGTSVEADPASKLVSVRGSTDLVSFPVTVTPVDPVVTGLPTAPFVQGGITYEYRSFSLGGSNGTTGKGFLQVTVTHP